MSNMNLYTEKLHKVIAIDKFLEKVKFLTIIRF